jgi:hypothetical protein
LVASKPSRTSCLGPGEPHALAAAAGRGLHHHRVADVAGDPHRILGGRDVAEEAGHDVDARGLRELLGLDLVAHCRDRLWRRADKGDVVLGEHAREALALRQKTVAGVHGLSAGLLARLQDEIGLEVGLAGRRRPQPHGFIGHPHVRRAGIRVRIDGYGLDAHLAGSADDAAGDFAAIGDQDL